VPRAPYAGCLIPAFCEYCVMLDLFPTPDRRQGISLRVPSLMCAMNLEAFAQRNFRGLKIGRASQRRESFFGQTSFRLLAN
jgi:hypothetical protein